MSIQTWRELLVTQTAAGTSFGTFTTAKTVINPQALFTFPAGFFSIGKRLNIRVAGGVGTLVTTPGTITFQVMVGSVIAFTTGALQLNPTAHTDLPFWLDIMLTCISIGDGTNGTMKGQAKVSGVMFTETAAQVDGVK